MKSITAHQNAAKLAGIILATIGLSACGLTNQQIGDISALEHCRVPPDIFEKVVHNEPLDVPDIAALSQAHVDDSIITRYIRDHHTIYYLTPAAVSYLQKRGVSQSIIDFMLATAPPMPPSGYQPPTSEDIPPSDLAPIPPYTR